MQTFWHLTSQNILSQTSIVIIDSSILFSSPTCTVAKDLAHLFKDMVWNIVIQAQTVQIPYHTNQKESNESTLAINDVIKFKQKLEMTINITRREPGKPHNRLFISSDPQNTHTEMRSGLINFSSICKRLYKLGLQKSGYLTTRPPRPNSWDAFATTLPIDTRQLKMVSTNQNGTPLVVMSTRKNHDTRIFWQVTVSWCKILVTEVLMPALKRRT